MNVVVDKYLSPTAFGVQKEQVLYKAVDQTLLQCRSLASRDLRLPGRGAYQGD